MAVMDTVAEHISRVLGTDHDDEETELHEPLKSPLETKGLPQPRGKKKPSSTMAVCIILVRGVRGQQRDGGVGSFSLGFLVAGLRAPPRLTACAPAEPDCSAGRRQVFVLVGLSVFIASAKMAIDQDSASVAIDHAQMNDLKNIIKKQVKHSMAPAIKMQKRAVKARKTDTGEVEHLEHQV